MKTKKLRILYTYEIGSTVTIEVPERVTAEQLQTALQEGGILEDGTCDIADEKKETFGYQIAVESCYDQNDKPDWSCMHGSRYADDMIEGLEESKIYQRPTE